MIEENELPDFSIKKTPSGKESSLADGHMLVAIGASAGGVEALQTLFSVMPVDTGVTFVVILHTTAEANSHLAEIIQRQTSIPVITVRSSAKLRVNHIYCLPSDKEVELLDGEVLITDRTLSEERRVPIDLFFRSVAGTYKERAISMILSGTGSDGSPGYWPPSRRGRCEHCAGSWAGGISHDATQRHRTRLCGLRSPTRANSGEIGFSPAERGTHSNTSRRRSCTQCGKYRD